MHQPTDVTRLQHDYLAQRYKDDPWLWAKQQAKTFDEHLAAQGLDAVRPFPAHKEYLAKTWELCERYRVVFEEKSRQMFETWRHMAREVQRCQFFPFARFLISSKDEDDSMKALYRCWFIWENQEQWLKERFPAEMAGNEITFYHRIGTSIQKTSTITALAKGEGEVRSMVGSTVALDEAAFAEHARGFIGAALPMLGNSGRLRVWSSANPGYYQGAIKNAKASAVRHEVVIPGVEAWFPADTTGILVLRVHHTADPEITEKVAQVKRSYEALGELAQYRKEYEIQYDALSGERVWPNLSKELHGIEPFEIPENWVRFRVIDPGYRNPCAINWFAMSEPGWRGCVDLEGKPLSVMVGYRELHLVNFTVDQIYREMAQASEGEVYAATLIDPSSDIHRGNERAGMSTFEQFIDLGVTGLIKANNAVEAGIGEVRRRLAIHGKTPALLFFTTLEHTWEECSIYHYANQTIAVQANRNPEEVPVKKHDHHPDNVRYGCQWRQLPRPEEKPKAPERSFGWWMEQHAQSRRWASLLGNTSFSRRIG